MGKASQLPLIVFCGLLLTASAFSCDITLPAVSSMQQELGASIEWRAGDGAGVSVGAPARLRIGGAGGWRAIFSGMAVFAGVLLAAAVVWFSETNPAPDRDALRRQLTVLSIPLLAGSLLSWAVTMLGVTGVVLLPSRRYRPAYPGSS